MGETFNRLADFGLRIAQKCAWRSGSARTCWGAIALRRPHIRYKWERDGRGRKGLGIVRGGREGRAEVGRDGKGNGERYDTIRDAILTCARKPT